MRRRFKIFGFGVSALLVLGVAWTSFGPGISIFAGPADPLAANAPPFIWFKSEVIAKSYGGMGFAKPLFWLDDDTIYFPGHRLPESGSAGGVDRREIKNSLYEWRVGKPARIYTTEWDGRRLCANWGFIEYSIREKKCPTAALLVCRNTVAQVKKNRL